MIYARLKRLGIVAIVAVFCPAISFAEGAGQIEFVAGKVNAVGADGAVRILQKGAEINSGESIVTGDDGRYVSLQPDTQFRIDDYRYHSQGGEEKSFFSLLKGGLRTISGLIGKGNRANYQVTTPVATIGIRGTHYRLRLCDNDCAVQNRILPSGLYVSVGEGRIVLANGAGELNLDQGQAGFVANGFTPPAPTQQSPGLTPPQLDASPLFLAGEQRDQSGSSSNLLNARTRIDSLVGLSAIDNGGRGYFTAATINGLGQVVALEGPQLSIGPSLQDVVVQPSAPSPLPVLEQGTTTIQDAGSDGLINWGRWVSGQTGGDATLTFTGDQSLHYVFTVSPTPDAFFVPSTPATLTYNFIGGTPATSDSGGIGKGITSGTLTLNLDPAGSTLGVNFNVDHLNTNYAVNGATPINSAAFSFAANASGGTCNTGCSTPISGVFAGASAQSAGLTYEIQEATTHIHGAAAFAKQ